MGDSGQYLFSSEVMTRAYEQYLVPRIFEPWAQRLLEVVELRPGEFLVDVACGPGTVAGAAAVPLGRKGRVLALDLSPQMLAVARQRTSIPGVALIDFQESPAVPLAAPTGQADAVVCQQGLQFFPDQAAALAEMHRALKPGGRLGVAVWARMEQCPLFGALHRALKGLVPDELADLLYVPFNGPEPRVLVGLAERAGFQKPQTQTATLTSVFEGGVEQVVASLAGTAVGAGVWKLTPKEKAQLTAVAARELAPWLQGKQVHAPMQAHLLRASKAA